MLAIKPSSSSPRTHTLNLLPCTIQHDGPITVSQRHWNPQTQKQPSSPIPHSPEDKNSTSHPEARDSTTQVSYLRGRKLLGRALVLPQGYEGVVLQKTDEVVPNARHPMGQGGARGGWGRGRDEEDGEGDEEGEAGGFASEEVEAKFMERVAGFEKLVVWGHEHVPGGEDGYVKGIEEWVGFAEAMHAYELPASSAGAVE